MKDSGRGIIEIGVAAALAAALLALAGCGRTNKAADVAQDSMLVKDADVVEHKVDTAAAGATLVRDRGSSADAPSLTSGAPVKRASASVGTSSAGTLSPPKKVYPSPVLPPRDSTTPQVPPARIDPLVPPPTQQPVSPQPPAVIQPKPPTPPKTDSSADSLLVSAF